MKIQTTFKCTDQTGTVMATPPPTPSLRVPTCVSFQREWLSFPSQQLSHPMHPALRLAACHVHQAGPCTQPFLPDGPSLIYGEVGLASNLPLLGDILVVSVPSYLRCNLQETPCNPRAGHASPLFPAHWAGQEQQTCSRQGCARPHPAFRKGCPLGTWAQFLPL